MNYIWAVLAVLLIGGVNISHAQEEFDAATAFGSLEAISHADISPDGKLIATQTVFRGRPALRIDTLDGSRKPVVWRPAEGAEIGEFSWTADNHILMMTEKLAVTIGVSLDPKKSRTRRYAKPFMAIRPRLLSSEGKMVTNLTLERLGQIQFLIKLGDSEFFTDDYPTFMGTTNSGQAGTKFAPTTISLKSDRFRFLDTPSPKGGIYQYQANPRGTVTFATFREFDNDNETLWRNMGGQWQNLNPDFLQQYSIMEVIDQDTLLVFNGQIVRTYNVADETLGEVLKSSVDGVSTVWTSDKNAIAGFRTFGDINGMIWLNEEEADRHRAAEAAIGVGALMPEDASLDGRVRVLSKSAASEMTRYFVWYEETASFEELGVALPKLSDVTAAPVEKLNYMARDGLPIEAYLTVPEGKELTDLPLVVLPHGGPASRDHRRHYDVWRQYLVHRGYAVFQPNFRGSTGYGRAFSNAGYGEWGEGMQNDLVDGVQHLINEYDADEDRLAILGASYGGYAALMGTLDETPYRCAVSVNGVSNLETMLNVEQLSSSFTYWAAHIGRDTLSKDDIRQRSPEFRAKEIDIPVLLIHGNRDFRVRPAQTIDMVRKLKRAGKEYEVLYLENSDHYLRDEADRIAAFSKMGSFLDKCFDGANE